MNIEPTEDQRRSLSESEDSGPVVMVNLLRFKERADGGSERSGAEAYAAYGAQVAPLLERVGGELLLVLGVTQTVIGPEDRVWDMIALARYPSPSAFLSMVTAQEYAEIHADRASGLDRTELLMCTQLMRAGEL